MNQSMSKITLIHRLHANVISPIPETAH